MATYKEIIGTNIEVVSSDPSDPVTGQVWYNTTTDKIKAKQQFIGNAWSSGGNLNNPKGHGAAAGTQTATITFGGIDGDDGSTELAETELYNGSTWTELNDLNTARRFLAGAGTSTSGLAFGGNPSPRAITESWNGTSWTETGDLNTGRRILMGTGSSNTNALAFGGNPAQDVNESWNGSSWTELNDLNTGRDQVLGGAGSNTDALIAGGQPPTRALTESWNGTSWFELNDLNTAVTNNAFVGESTSALSYGGGPGSGSVQNTESWNGSVFTESNDMSVSREGAPGGGANNTAALAFGGFPLPISATEEWNANVAVGAWITGGNLNTGRNGNLGLGTRDAALSVAGEVSDDVFSGITEAYNGTTYSEVNDLNQSRRGHAGAGTAAAGLAFGGQTPPYTAKNE